MNYSNNAFSVIVGAIASANTIIALAPGTGSRFPASDFRATLVGYDVNGNEDTWEIVHCSSRSGDVLTVTRGQEGTSAVAWDNGARIENRITAGSMAALEPTITPGTTAQYLLGNKTWRDFFTDVRAATLTGLSTATNAVVAATDTVLAAIGKLQAQVSAKFDKTGGDVDGNINFTGTARRITGDFSNATIANRLAFQTSAVNGITSVSAVPNGSGTVAQYSLYNRSDVNNATLFDSLVNSAEARIRVLAAGTGSNLPLVFQVGGLERLRIDPTTGNVLATSGALGYGVGAGGTVVQATSKSTAVTLNRPSGRITMHNAALAAGAFVVFNFTNATIAYGDEVSITMIGGINYRVETIDIWDGACTLRVTNISASSLSDALAFNFKVFKGAWS